MKVKLTVDKIPQDALLKLLPLKEGRSIFYEKDKYLSVKGDEKDNDEVVEYLFRNTCIESLAVHVEDTGLQVQTIAVAKSKKTEHENAETTAEAESKETVAESETEDVETVAEAEPTEPVVKFETEDVETAAEEVEPTESVVESQTEDVETAAEEVEPTESVVEFQTEDVEKVAEEVESTETVAESETEDVETTAEADSTKTVAESETEDVETSTKDDPTEVVTELETETVETAAENDSAVTSSKNLKTEKAYKRRGRVIELTEDDKAKVRKKFNQLLNSASDKSDFLKLVAKEGLNLEGADKRRIFISGIKQAEAAINENSVLVATKWSSKVKLDFSSISKKYFGITLFNFVEQLVNYIKEVFDGESIKNIETAENVTEEISEELKTAEMKPADEEVIETTEIEAKPTAEEVTEEAETAEIEAEPTAEEITEKAEAVENGAEPIAEEATEEAETVENGAETTAEEITEEAEVESVTKKVHEIAVTSKVEEESFVEESTENMENFIIFTKEERDSLKTLSISERAVLAFNRITEAAQLENKELAFSLEVFKVAMERRNVRKFESIYVDTLKGIGFSIDVYPARMCWAKIAESYTGNYIQVADFFEIAQKQILTEEEYEKVRR